MLRTLKGDKKIETLFEKGFVLKEKNILLKGYDFGEEESFFGVSVSKRFFKSAVDFRGNCCFSFSVACTT